MNRQPKIIIEEQFISENVHERQQRFNELLFQVIKKSEIQKIA